MTQLMKRGGTWYVRFHHGGRDIWRSTKTTNRKEASGKVADIVEEVKGTASLSALFDRVLAGVTAITDDMDRDRTRREFARKLLQGTTSKLAVSDAWATWLTNPRKGKRAEPKASTLTGYSAMWDRFAGEDAKPERRGWLLRKHEGVKYLHEITETMTEDYATDLWGSGVSPATYNAHVKFLKSMFKTLAIKAGLSLNPWEPVRTIETETEGKRALTEAELSKVCSKATGDLRYWLAIGIYTGLRLGDVVTLRWSEVKLKDGFIERIPLKVDRKGERKKIKCPLHPVLAAMLTELHKKAKADTDLLFPSAVTLYHKDRAAITRQVQQHFTDCGIVTTEAVGESHRRRAILRVGFHSLRHSFVSLCAANHVPQVAIMELVGHGSPAMTELYMHANTEQKSDAIAALPAAIFANGKHDEADDAR